MVTSVVFKGMVYLSSITSPYNYSGKTFYPSIEVEHRPTENLYFDIESSARCNPSLSVMNPVTAKWVVEAGAVFGNFKVGLGHSSEHAVGISTKYEPLLESFDYLRAEYRMEFK